jgi:hypothetical protein
MATRPHLLCLVLMLAGSARADVYLHNPRGSNNKLNEVRCTTVIFPFTTEVDFVQELEKSTFLA